MIRRKKILNSKKTLQPKRGRATAKYDVCTQKHLCYKLCPVIFAAQRKILYQYIGSEKQTQCHIDLCTQVNILKKQLIYKYPFIFACTFFVTEASIKIGGKIFQNLTEQKRWCINTHMHISMNIRLCKTRVIIVLERLSVTGLLPVFQQSFNIIQQSFSTLFISFSSHLASLLLHKYPTEEYTKCYINASIETSRPNKLTRTYL